MKTALIATLTALAAVPMEADEHAQGDSETVIICTELAASKDARPAVDTVTRVFAELGIGIDWRPKLAACPPEGIKVTLRFDAPVDDHPGAMAYALPYEGSHICVLYNRIAAQGHERLAYLIAYVIVHEVTHMLQGVMRHSADGIMKARWSREDFECMKTASLGFTNSDIEWLRLGLAARAARFARETATIASH